ncbi:zf-HC2 domain-containing protein [Cellulomonas sp. HZM]|uniref:zf-HC2 domain-containing protein n=1 Tax=Cellulomonas sp. HZM TaxID=1454010 RepID=UPI00049357BF|nr:zf-HC2 domain-containing protein [Cellulomonas sp. HZM]
MSHLGSRISALVDGQLAPAAAERALAHVATCDECAAELAAARAARAALAASQDVAPDDDLTARLLSLGVAMPAHEPVRSADPFAPPPRRTEHDLASYGLHRGPARRAWEARSGAALCGEVPLRRMSTRLLAGSVAGVGAVAAMLFVLGEQPDVVAQGRVAPDLDLLGHAATVQVDAVDAGVDDLDAWVDRHGWPFPTQLPAGWSLVGWRTTDEGSLEVDLTGPAGPVVVTEQAGRLDEAAVVGAQAADVEGIDAVLLSTEPWHVAWQSGDTVVQVVAGRDSGAARSFVAGFPVGAADGVPARMWRGWTTVAGVLDQS